MKWGFAPNKTNAINVDALQNKCELRVEIILKIMRKFSMVEA